MSDVLAIANKRLEALKAEVAKIEQFLAFAAELTRQSSPGAASAAPPKEPVAQGAASTTGATTNTGGFRLRDRPAGEDSHEDLSKLMRS